MAEQSNKPPHDVCFVEERKNQKAHWTRIGAAWRHEKGDGLTMQLDLLPVNGGRIILRTPKDDKREGEGA